MVAREAQVKRGKVLQIVRGYVARLAKRLRVEEVILFGSSVTGEWLEESDVDLVVISPDFDGMKFLERLGLLQDSWRSGLALEALGYTREEFEYLRRRSVIVGEASEKGLVIFERRPRD